MSGEAEVLGGCCAICFSSTLTNWCNLKAFGGGNGRGGCCGGPRGCCHSCFSAGFDEDAWDKKDKESRQRKRASAGQAEMEQPTATPQMVAPTSQAVAPTPQVVAPPPDVIATK